MKCILFLFLFLPFFSFSFQLKDISHLITRRFLRDELFFSFFYLHRTTFEHGVYLRIAQWRETFTWDSERNGRKLQGELRASSHRRFRVERKPNRVRSKNKLVATNCYLASVSRGKEFKSRSGPNILSLS